MVTNPDLEGDIPLEVTEFFVGLNSAVESNDIATLHSLYENQFDSLTKTFYVASNQWRSWPALRLPQVQECFPHKPAEHVYSFLYHKHLFTDRGVMQTDASASWATFNDLFADIANGKSVLPSWMLWDIFDEFVFQMTVVYQKRFATGTEWSIEGTFKIMQGIIESTRIKETMGRSASQDALAREGNMNEQCGFFAVVTRAKINVLLGDYHSALAGLEMLDIYGAGGAVLQKVPPAAVSLLYNVGFSYLMLHRYEDASNSLRRCFAAKLSGRRFSERLQLDAAYMYVCARVLGGMVLGNVSSYVEQRKRLAFDDDKESLRMGDEERFRDIFDRCSPKFISVPPVGASVKGTEGKELQARMFRRAVQQQQEIMRLRDFFGVYQNTTVSQLQSLLEAEDTYAPFIALKMHSRQLVHDGESADLLSGLFRISSQNDCVVSGDNVEVVPLTNFGSTENKLLNKIKSLQRVEYRQAQRKHQQNKPKRDGEEGAGRRQNRNNNNNNAGGRRPANNRNNAGGQQQRNRPRNNMRQNNTNTVVAPAENLLNRNMS